ncbi:MAG TPA: glycine oxidase ThiO [Candidatus Acidoferrum sp.]|nr:glycine oxidase ThiO [Candidatus Acidoferrum sp.]
MKTTDVAIIGGGIIGASIAMELSARRVCVSLFDRQSPGCEASWAAAGMLSPAPDGLPAIPLIPLARESLRIYPAFVQAVEAASSRSADFERDGAIHLFAGENSPAERDAVVSQYRSLGLAIDPLPIDEARRREPFIGPHISAAAWNPDEARVDPRHLTAAILAAAQNLGARIRHDARIEKILFDANRCTGLALASGEEISAAHVVLAAGSFSGGILGDAAPRIAPTHPVRGQMLALRAKGWQLRHVLRSEHAYLVPRKDGRIIAGSTLEDAGFEKCVTPAGLQSILSAAIEMAPVLASAEIVETWSGLRPGTPDELPLLGPTNIEGLIVATGHYRNGILLAPVTAQLVREWILEGKTSFDASAYSPLRFAP